MSQPVYPIHTSRLKLRPFECSDYPAYQSYHSLKEVYRYLYCDPPSGASMKRQFEKCQKSSFEHQGDALHLAVVRTKDDTLLGEVLLKFANVEARQGEVGYIFNPIHGGGGYASEATAAIISLGFEHFDLHRIFARLDPLNIGSVRLVERLGLRREAHLIQNDQFNGVWGDEFIYACLRDEWDAEGGIATGERLSGLMNSAKG